MFQGIPSRAMLRKGDSAQVYSRSLDGWFKGTVTEILEDGVRVEFHTGEGRRCRKTRNRDNYFDFIVSGDIMSIFSEYAGKWLSCRVTKVLPDAFQVEDFIGEDLKLCCKNIQLEHTGCGAETPKQQVASSCKGFSPSFQRGTVASKGCYTSCHRGTVADIIQNNYLFTY